MAPKNRIRAGVLNLQIGVKFGLGIAGRTPSSGAVISVQCMFCEMFGREAENDKLSGRKRKRTENSKYFESPLRVDNIARHMKMKHALKYAEYESLSV